jgi:hypothetical protein
VPRDERVMEPVTQRWRRDRFRGKWARVLTVSVVEWQQQQQQQQEKETWLMHSIAGAARRWVMDYAVTRGWSLIASLLCSDLEIERS